MGVPQARWLVYFTESPKQKWMIWGYPYLRKPPYDMMILGFFQNFEPPNIVKTPGRVASIPGISYKFSYIAQFESPSGWIRIPTGMMEDHGVRNMMG